MAQPCGATLSANDKAVLAEGDHGRGAGGYGVILVRAVWDSNFGATRRSPQSEDAARSAVASRRMAKPCGATLSANDKAVLAEGDHGFVGSGEGGIRTHE